MSFNLAQNPFHALTSFPNPDFKVFVKPVVPLPPLDLNMLKLLLLDLQTSSPVLIAPIWWTVDLVMKPILLEMGVNKR